MQRLIHLCVVVMTLSGLTSCGDDESSPSKALTTPPREVSSLDPDLDQTELTIQFTVSKLDGVAQLHIPGQSPVFIIEANSEHKDKDLNVWIEGELADVMDRLQLSFGGKNPLQKGTKILATGRLSFSPGAGDRVGHEWYSLKVDKWQNFRIVVD